MRLCVRLCLWLMSEDGLPLASPPLGSIAFLEVSIHMCLCESIHHRSGECCVFRRLQCWCQWLMNLSPAELLPCCTVQNHVHKRFYSTYVERWWVEVAYRGLKTVGGEEGGINVCVWIRAIDDCFELEIWIRFQWNFILRANAEYFLSVRK